MKLKAILAACLFVAGVHYASLAAPVPVPVATWNYYQAMGTNISSLRAKIRTLNKAHGDLERKLALQAKAGQISYAASRNAVYASAMKLQAEDHKISQEIAELELKRIAIQDRYKIKP